MGEHGCTKTSSNHCVFIKYFSDDDFLIFLLYIDNMLITGKKIFKIDRLKEAMSKSFLMKDLGLAK